MMIYILFWINSCISNDDLNNHNDGSGGGDSGSRMAVRWWSECSCFVGFFPIWEKINILPEKEKKRKENYFHFKLKKLVK